jgi:hypothetical protein
MVALAIALSRAYPGTTWEYWAEQDHAVVNEAAAQASKGQT